MHVRLDIAMTHAPKMTLEQARRIMDGWRTRTAETKLLVPEANKLLQRAWDKRKMAAPGGRIAWGRHLLS
jgi:hypothetical protein